MALNFCAVCFEKQMTIDRLEQENARLRQKLRSEERRGKEGLFGSSTPSSKLPVKTNTPVPTTRKPRGARQGHQGSGRKLIEETAADRVIDIAADPESCCPLCHGVLEQKGVQSRSVIESRPIRAEREVYHLPKRYCPRCRKAYHTPLPGVLPRSLYGNALITAAATMHYLHGMPLGRICEQIGIGPGSLVEVFHRLSRLFEHVPQGLIEQYRTAPVKHADETGWRTEGKNGYAWLFATPTLSIFQFRKTRSAEVPRAIFGQAPLPGTLVVDRYAGYNKVPCAIQYCYAHLLRDVESLEQEFPDAAEVNAFASTLAPLLALAMGLRNQQISDTQFSATSAEVKAQIIAAVESPAAHLGIRRIQNIFRDNASRLYHWAADRAIPAENNLAERGLRPTVIARKVSFGSQSDAGAKTRGILMSVLVTLKKRGVDVTTRLKEVLDEIARNPTQNPFSLLFPRAGP
jgi:transposase